MRTAEQMYEEAVKVCMRVAMTEGDHDFMVTREEYLLLQSQPFRSWIGTAVDRETITGKPKRLCGLVLKIKEDEPKPVPESHKYRKIQFGHCDYPRLMACQEAGEWMCDSEDHNESRGCSNPTCAKWNKAPECDCGGEPTFHGHTRRCPKGTWLLSLDWYAKTMDNISKAFNGVFEKP